MSIAKYVIAKGLGLSNALALLYAKDILRFAGGGYSGGPYLLLSSGGRLLLTGYGENVKLLVEK